MNDSRIDYLEIIINRLKEIDNDFCNDKLLEYNILIEEEEFKKVYKFWDDLEIALKIKTIKDSIIFKKREGLWSQ